MKKMLCHQLGGACDKAFIGETFEEIAQQSKQHGGEMYQIKDPAHMKAMAKMSKLMQSPAAMQEWFEDKRKAFEALPDIT